MTTTALISALAPIKIVAKNGDEKLAASLHVFNKAVSNLMQELIHVVPTNEDGHYDFFDYFLFTHWLDLGQLLFALDRSNSVNDALRPIRHITTGSRDFWTDYCSMANLHVDK